MGINEFIKIGSIIKDFRKMKGLTQKEMARRLNIPYSTYSNYENDNREPNKEMINKIADVLGIDVNILISHAQSDLINEMDIVADRALNDLEQRGYLRDAGDLELLQYFRQLNYKGQDKIIDYAKDLVQLPEYRADNPDDDQ